MATTTFYADRIQIIDPDNPDVATTSESIGSTELYTSDSRKALMHFDFPSELNYRRIKSVSLALYTEPRTSTSGGQTFPFTAKIQSLNGAFDSSVTWNTRPESTGTKDFSGGTSAGYRTLSLGSASASVSNSYIVNALRNGIFVFPITPALLVTSTNTHRPYVTVSYEDSDSYGVVSGNPSGGYIDKSKSQTFRWSYSPPANIVADEPIVSNAKFGYKKASGDAYTYLDAGTSTSYTTTAGFFADTNTVIWYPRITLDTGDVIYPQNAYSLTTVEPTFSALPISPDATVEDGSAPIVFTWSATNNVGSAPSGAELQYSTDGGANWQALGSVTGSTLNYIAAANALPGGEISWRVRALNSAGTAGSWSTYLNFICVAAPAAPSVRCDAAPFTTIEWEATGQEAYEVTVDGASYGIRFGSEKSFTLPLPLNDGNHDASVRVQGSYGLWSQPGEVTFAVQNDPAGALDLTARFGVDAELLWAYSASGDDFLIFRDGVQIGHTAQNSFSDRRALGTHEWFVLLRQASGNYTKSNTVTGTLSTEYPAISLLAGGPWISLRLSERSIPEHRFVYSQTHTLRYFSGSPFPVLELTPYKDLSGTYSCAFSSQAEARAFEALFGNVVIMKSNESVIIGGMVNLKKVRSTFYAAYQFTLQQIAVEEIVDDPDS